MKRDDTLTVLASELDQLMNSSALFENELLRIDTYTPEDRALIQRRRDLLILLAGIADYHGYDGIALQMFYRVTYASSALEETQVITSGITP
jgi:hypothetical protein